ncbi:hypothetical protein Celaphus_00008750 [Cervus elaphus hippelaphus]|uniref:Transforming acidic coiled-coil-containing protein 2 n=1 Tax=Cervus elaphus hippelaphus TaxID=46360 RepID=A0A212CP90_CEREH|nr:hypothetical protein Celaphus_00008750 [Cervus elaphus hippelaphus]
MGARTPELALGILEDSLGELEDEQETNGRTSSARSPESVQPPGNSQRGERKPEEAPRGADPGGLPSVWHGGSSSASEGAASPDPCLVSPEVTEPREHPQAARGPEDSPHPSAPEPQERESPSSSMRFAEGSPEGCLASPEGEHEGWPLVQHPQREPSPNGPGEAPAAPVPQDDNSTQNKVVFVVPGAGGETGSKDEEGQRLSSSSSTDELAGIPPTASPEPMKVQLCGENSWPGDFNSQEREAAAGFPWPESLQGAPKAPAAQLGQEGSASLEEPPLKPMTSTSQESAPECPVEGPPQDFTDDAGFLGPCPPTGTSSGAAHELEGKADSQESCQQPMGALPPAELPWDSPGPALAPGDKDSWEETLGARDAQGHSQTGSQDAEPSQVTWAAIADQPEGVLFMSPEPAPHAATKDAGPASSLPSLPAALASVAAEQAREMVSVTEMPVLTDLATERVEAGLSGPEKQASDLRGEGEDREGGPREIPAPAPLEERAELGNRELSHEVQPKVPALPTPRASDESASRSLGPKDEAKAPEDPAVAEKESRDSGADPRGQGAAPGPLDGADPGNLQAEQPEAWGCKPDPEVEKDEVSQLPGDETTGLPNTVLAQPLGEEIPGHADRSDSPSEDAAWNVVARGMMGESQVVHASGSLHKLPEQHPGPLSGPEGAGERVLPRGAIWAGPGLQTKCPDTLQDVEGLGRMDSLPALESEKSDFLSAPAPEVVPKAQEVESMPEIKSGSHPSAQRPGHGEGEGSLTPPHPHGLGRDAAGQEVHADGPPPPEEENWAKEMEHLTASDTEVPELSGIFPSVKDHGADGAETCGKADGGALGMWQALGEPGSLQIEQRPSPGEEASTPATSEQLSANCQDVWPVARELAGSPRSLVDLFAVQVAPDSKKRLPSGPPEEAAPGTPYLHIEGPARKGLEDSVVKAVSPQGPGAPGESPCSTREPLLASEKASSTEGSAESSLSQAGAAGEGISAAPASPRSPKAGTSEGPVDSVPYLDRMPFLAKGKQTTGEEKWSGAPGASAEPGEIPACPVSEESKAGEAARETKGRGERRLEPSKDPRRGASAGVDASCRQTGMLAGLPDFREHITKIFEKSVLGALTTDRPQSTKGEKVGAGKRMMEKGLTVPSPEKLPDATQGVAVAPLPTLPAGLWVDSKGKKQELTVEAEISRLGPQDPAPGKLPGLAWLAAEHNLLGASVGKEMSEALQMLADSEKPEGAGEGWWPGPGGVPAHSQQPDGPQESASGLSSQAASPKISGADLQVAPQSHGEGDSGPDDRIPSGKQCQETAHWDSQPREDGARGSSYPGALGDTPGSTSAQGASPHVDVPPLPEAISEPCTPDPLGGERRRVGAAGVSETQDALGTQGALEPPAGEVAENPLEPGLEARAAGEAEGDVTLSTAETGARVSEDLPETGTTRMFSGVAAASAVPGSPGYPGCSEGALRMDAEVAPDGGRPAGPPQAEEQPRPELPAFAEDGKMGVSSPPEPDETRDLKQQNLDPEALDAERKSPKAGPSTLPLVPEKDAPDITDKVISDDANSAGGAERSVKRDQPLENPAFLWERHAGCFAKDSTANVCVLI